MIPGATLPAGLQWDAYAPQAPSSRVRVRLSRDGHRPVSPAGLNPAHFMVTPGGDVLRLVPPRPRLDPAQFASGRPSLRPPARLTEKLFPPVAKQLNEDAT